MQITARPVFWRNGEKGRTWLKVATRSCRQKSFLEIYEFGDTVHAILTSERRNNKKDSKSDMAYKAYRGEVDKVKAINELN